MPRVKIYGDTIGVDDLGPRQVRGNNTTKAATPPIEVKKFCRNGLPVSAQYWNLLNEAVNASALYRTRELFSIVGDLGSAPGIQATSAAGTRPRWRAACRTGPLHHAMLCRAVMFPPSSNYANNTYATLEVYSDATESTLVTTISLFYGPGPTGTTSAGGWQYHRVLDMAITGLSADTDYYLVFNDVDYGRLQSACVIDLQSMTEGNDGHLPLSLSSDSEVLHVYRENVATIQKNLWKRSGAKVLGWTTNIQANSRSTTSASAINLIDGVSTTYTAAIPGYTLNMTGKARLSQTSGVPCIMKAYMGSTGAANGVVHLRDSAGSVVATCTNAAGAGVGNWVSSGAFNLPATTSKYYLTFQTAAGTVFVNAVSIWEHET